ncbi:hypothetical protein [Lysobacter gummosus]|uniref:hypothetical protein n=1 Tax=Lysobacter gummosus TaxID=262324 RepID=UPI00362D0B9D
MCGFEPPDFPPATSRSAGSGVSKEKECRLCPLKLRRPPAMRIVLRCRWMRFSSCGRFKTSC